MKVLIIASSDLCGGASRAAYRLHLSLLSSGVDSRMLVQNKLTKDTSIIGSANKIEIFINRVRGFVDYLPVRFYRNKTKTFFSTSFIPFSGIVNKINKIKPDIVHFHWINNGMIKIEDLLKIKVPIVWSLHDMWVFTGGCHYTEYCDRYKLKCGKCRVLSSNCNLDLSRVVFLNKKKVFSKIKNIQFIGLSRWISNCARESVLLKNKKIINIPNPIDTAKFKSIDKQTSRKILNLPMNKKIILFGAMSTDDPRKGCEKLLEALEIIKSNTIELVIFGSGVSKRFENCGFKIHYLGHINDDTSLAILYSAVDVLVVPSIQENLSNTIMESLSCSTPVVAFDIGGNGDMIQHKINGYLAKRFDVKDLADGINWIINSNNYDEICKNARDIVVKKFDSKVVSKQYLDMYNKILNN